MKFFNVEEDQRSKRFLILQQHLKMNGWNFQRWPWKGKWSDSRISLTTMFMREFDSQGQGVFNGDYTCPPSCTRTEVWFLATTVRMAKEKEGRRRRRIREVILIRIRIKYQQSPWLAWIVRSFLRIHQVGGGSESSFWRRSIETQVTLAFCFWSPDLRGVWGRVYSRISRSCGREADGQLWKKNAMFDRLGKQGVKGWILGLGTTADLANMLSLPRNVVPPSQRGRRCLTGCLAVTAVQHFLTTLSGNSVWQCNILGQCNTVRQHFLATMSGSAILQFTVRS